ncbi:TetR/AcrR family transcriptional regulator [Nocardia higoensis]|uniref:TetR/AcrR family transcriptional regulator n=1 Tax=Nocardia higoensis TaxID=228599 RepID=UPI000313DC93|nr:TetR/AcrR family transcriptional regulator C-terminal domain-containing protein [Nocardia higoensis]
MPRPRSLTGGDLAAAALAVIDREGLSALTMRAVAKELGVATMALYRYVPDRGALEVLVVESVFGAVDTSVPAGLPWAERVEMLAERVRVAVGAHPQTVPLLLAHRQSARSGLRWMEAVLTVLTHAGFDGVDRVIAQRTLVGYLFGFLHNAHYASLAGDGTAALAEMSADEFPHLVATARSARTVSAEEEFRGGLAIVLRGLRPH